MVLACALCIFLYVKLDNKKKFLPLLLVLGIIFICVIVISPIKNKFVDTFSRTKNGIDPLVAFTSGRSDFWYYDIVQIFNNDFLKKTIGNGVNYIFYLNQSKYHIPLWAHNDFIQILGDYGFLGLIIYVMMIRFLIVKIIGKNFSKSIIFICVIMWLFNAFFNMFYTYFCACLSFPFYLLIVRIDSDRRKKGEFESEKNIVTYMVSKQ